MKLGWRREAEERSRWRTAGIVTAAFVAGALAGALAWSTQIQRSRRDLFGASRVRRLAALGYLAGQPGVETVRLLGEYVKWERQPMLRKRGQQLLHELTQNLD